MLKVRPVLPDLPDPPDFGAWLKAARAEREWTQMDVAIQLRTGLSTVQAWEQGRGERSYAALWHVWLVFEALPFGPSAQARGTRSGSK
jgi:hypothetical protein